MFYTEVLGSVPNSSSWLQLQDHSSSTWIPASNLGDMDEALISLLRLGP